MAELVTFAIETTGDCSTGASFPLRLTASWPEAFSVLSDMARVALCKSGDLNQSEAAKNLMCKIRMGVGLMTYLVVGLSPGLQGLGGAFFALFCDPALPRTSPPDLERSSRVVTLRGVCDDYPSVTAALRAISVGGTVSPLSDLASSFSSSTLMVSMPELTIVMSADTVGPILFLFFLASAV
jgi:hypothetical protein